MMNYHYLKKALFAAALLIITTATTMGQCIIPITNGQSYVEDFEGEVFDCWIVDSINGAHWTTMTGTESTVAAFSNAGNQTGAQARLISPIFDFTEVEEATLSFSYAMMGLYNVDLLVISYRNAETDPWHDLGSFSFSDWENFHEQTYDLPDLSATYQISFQGIGYGGYYILIDNVEIISALGCSRPINIQATNITAFSALINWSTSGNEAYWTLDIDGHERIIDTQPFLLEDLLPQTLYTVRVKAHCDEEMESDWSVPITFTTHCDVILVTDEEPYFDDFESSEHFVCWQDEIISGNYGWDVDPGYYIPNNSAFFFWQGDEAWLVSTFLDLSSVTKPILTFRHRQRVIDQRVDELSVWYATSYNDAWHMLGEYTEACPEWETITLSLPDPSATYLIGFRGKANDADGIYVDDVWIGNDPNVGIIETNMPATTVTPNPTTGRILVESLMDTGTITVFDLYGHQITQATLSAGRAEIDLSNYSKGIYVAQISNSNGTTNIKLVKE